MRMGVGLACRPSFASALPSRCFQAADVRCSSSLSYPSTASISTNTSLDHVAFIRDVALANPPERLHFLLNILQARGETVVPPEAKKGLIPLVIPLSESLSGGLTSLLRWPTSPPEMAMPVVEVKKHGVWYLAKSVDQYIHRMLAEEDAKGIRDNKFWENAADFGREFYNKGDLISSCIADLDTYLLKKVGLFPDVIERKVARHLQTGDHVSALITGEFYARNHFPGFGRPFVFNAEILLKFVEFSTKQLKYVLNLVTFYRNILHSAFFSRVGRKAEAKDAARGALKSPWWTLGCRYQEVAEMAQWEDEQIEYIKEKVTEEGKKEDLKKGKLPQQVALDEAAFLLDLASIDGSWDEVVDRVAECYTEAGLADIAKFVKCNG